MGKETQWWDECRIEDKDSIERVAQTGLLIMYHQKALPDKRKDVHEMSTVRSKQEHEQQSEESHAIGSKETR